MFHFFSASFLFLFLLISYTADNIGFDTVFFFLNLLVLVCDFVGDSPLASRICFSFLLAFGGSILNPGWASRALVFRRPKGGKVHGKFVFGGSFLL